MRSLAVQVMIRKSGFTKILLPFLFTLALLGQGCGKTTDDRIRLPDGTPVVIITIDTLRSDRLPAYGYSVVETPAIDRLASESILFEHAYSPVPLTLPAHVSILTGLLPHEHGVRDNAGYRLETGALRSLPETVSGMGYRTGCAVSSFVLRGSTGLSDAFDFYEDGIDFSTRHGLGGLERPGSLTLERTKPWLAGVAEKPFFLLFHIYEPHYPYSPPEPFASQYSDPYDGEIAAADSVVGRLIDELERLGIYDRAAIVLTSDHGEGLRDHGEQEHGLLLYREALEVPLLLRLPGAAHGGLRISSPAQLVDIFPTLLELLGREPPAGLAGISLLRLTQEPPPERTIHAETLYPRLHFGWSGLTSLISWPHHYIAGPDPELYDLSADPGELDDLIDREPAVGESLAGALDQLDAGLEPPARIDDDTREKLAALGYVGSKTGLTEGPLPDPKRHVHEVEELKKGIELFAHEDYEQAIATLRRILSRNAQMLDAWDYLGRALEQAGRETEALEAYDAAMDICAACGLLELQAARLLFREGRIDDAWTLAQSGAGADPPAAYGLQAQIAMKRGDLDLAERLAREALDAGDSRLGPMLTLADLMVRKNEFEQAVDLLQQARTIFTARSEKETDLIRGLHFLLGQALANLGRAPEAELAFLEEIKLFPEEVAPYTHLAVLYALVGREDRAAAALERLVAINPSPFAYAEAVKTCRELGDVRSAAALLEAARNLYPESGELRRLARP